MKNKIVLTAAGAFTLVGFSPVFSQTVLDVDLSANGTSRAYDYFSNAFAEINLNPDGMYDITTPTTQYGSVDAFPFEGAWNNAGTLTLDGTATGTGTENFNIIDASFDFNPFIDGSVTFITGENYSTSLSAVSGTVQLVNGVVDDLSFSSDIAFTFPSSPANPYDGSFTMTETTFDLSVDDTETAFAIRLEWDAAGGASFTAVPEPDTFGFVAALAALAFASAGRRSRKS